MVDVTQLLNAAARHQKLAESRVRKQADIELDKFNPKDTERLLRFHVTKQNIVDRANEFVVDFPWESEIAYSSFHKAMDGKPVYEGVVRALEDLETETTRNPRQYLPKPPDCDDLAAWMKQVAGPKWWHGTLCLDCSLNVLTGWSSGRSMRQDQLEDLKQRVADWWERVEAACAQADMVRRYDAAERVPEDTEVHMRRVESWDTWIMDQIEDGMTLDEARSWYLDLKSKLTYSRLDMLDLTAPEDPLHSYEGDKWEGWRTFFRDGWAQWFDERAALGFPLAVPRHMPKGTDLTPYEQETQWGDRRIEEGPKDVNEPIYKMWYRERIERFWDADAREVGARSEIVAVSVDGQGWRVPSEREKLGWERQSLANARYRFENDGESPVNSYTREVEEARQKMIMAERAWDEGFWDEKKVDALERALKAARRDYEAALNDY